MIGNVASGGIFATLQSAGMGGYGLAIVNGAVQVSGAAASMLGLGKWTWAKSEKSDSDKKNDAGEKNDADKKNDADEKNDS